VFDANGNMPQGIHPYSWSEFARTFGWNARREFLLQGMLEALQYFRSLGCQRVYIDGSFVTSKDTPSDYDAAWDRSGMTLVNIDPMFRSNPDGRIKQKAMYGGEWFPASGIADGADTLFLEFFQIDRSNNVKGIVLLEMESVP